MTDLDQFRADTRTWLEANCPPEMRKPVRAESDVCWGGRDQSKLPPAQKQWMDAMGAPRWTVPDCPTAYGGGGLTAAETTVPLEAMRRITARNPLKSYGITNL